MRRPIAALVLLGMLALPLSAGAVVVHGLHHAPLGAATIGEAGTTEGVALSIDNIGSSGQDGVSFDLAGADGMSLSFTRSAIAFAPIGQCHTALWRGGTTITMVGNSFRTINSMGRLEVGMDVPGATEIEVEIWNDDRLVCSQTVPVGTNVIQDVAAGEVCDDGNMVDMRITRSQDDEVIKSWIVADHRFPASGPVTLGGAHFVGDRYVLRAGVPLRTDPVLGYLLASSTGGGSGGGGGSIYVLSERIVFDPWIKRGPPRPSACAMAGESGVALTAGPAPHVVALAPDGSGDPVAVRIANANRPNISFDPRGTNSMGVAMLPQSDPPSGQTVSTTLEMRASWDPNTGLPPQDVSHAVTWTSSTPGFWQHDVYSDDPFIAQVIRVRRGGGLVLHESAGVTYATSKPPNRYQVSGGTNTPGCTALVSYPGGTVITISGQTFAADEVQMVYSHGTGGSMRRISDVRIVHPPSTPPASMMRITNLDCVPTEQAVHGGGRGFFGRGPRQSTSVDGAYYVVDNLGHSGQDGIEIPFHGVPSVDLKFHSGSPPLVDGAPPALLGLSTYPCDDGSCPPSSELRVTNSHALGEPIAMSIISSVVGKMWMQVNGDIYPFHVADLDGDGAADIAPTSSSGAPVARISYQEYPDAVSSSQRWEVDFHGPVTVHTPSGPTSTNAVTVHRDVLKGYFETGSVPTQDQFARVWTLPAGQTDTYGVSTLVMEEPGMHTSSCAAPGIPITIHGEPFASTVSKVKGPVKVAEPRDDDCNGFTVEPGDLYDVTSSSPEIQAISNLPGMRGFAATFDLPSLASSPEPTQIEMKTRGHYGGGMNDVWRVMLSTGDGSSSMQLLPVGGGPPASNTWTVRSSGPPATATFSDGTTLAFTAPPSAIAIGDLDRDGWPDLRVMGFPPGTQASVGGSMVPCEEVTVVLTSGPQVTSLDECAMRLAALHGGLENVRLARLANADEIVGVGPVTPTGPALAVAVASPNPFVDATSLRFTLREASSVRARVIDVTGREVARLADARYEAGEHVVRWDGRTKAGALARAGIYFLRVERAGGETAFVRITRLR